MSDHLTETVLLRRKLLAERGYRPIPCDGRGNPAGAAWRAEALQDPPRATLIPVDPNASFTAVLLGADGEEEALIAVGCDIGLGKRGSSQDVAEGGLEDREDREALFAAVIAALDERIGRTPLLCLRRGELVFFYRSRRSPAWDWADIKSAGVFIVDDEDHAWPDRRPEDVAFAALPFLDNETWKEAIAAGVGAQDGPLELDELLSFEEIPVPVEPPDDEERRGFGPHDRPREDVRKRTSSPPPLAPLGVPPIVPPAPGDPPPGPPPERPKIKIKAGKRHLAADQGLAALHDAGVPFYHRGGELVRIERFPAKDGAGGTVWIPAIRAVPLPAVARALGQVAIWQRLTPDGVPYQVDPPPQVVEMIMGMADRWPFRPIAGIARSPTLRSDLSLLDQPGYDPQTALFAAFDGNLKIPRIAARPSRRQAEDALKLLIDAFASFPFIAPRDQATAIAALLTAVCRPAIEISPMFIFNAPLAGTGKTYLAHCVAAVATGNRAAVIAMAPKEEETEKRLVGAAFLGNPLIVLDNCRRLLEGDFLCQATEQPLLQLRPLGTSDVRVVPNTFVIIATGNNVVTAADMTRRALQSAMDANCERPELREFDGDPRREILAHRGDFIAACLTIPRYYVTAGRPNLRPRMASYEQWSDLIRSPLVHLGLADPVETQRILLAGDPKVQQRRAVFTAWAEALRGSLVPAHENGLRIRELIELATASQNGDLLEALMEVAEGQHAQAGRLDNGRLGRWMGMHEGVIADGWKLVCDRSDSSRPRWRLDPVIPAVED
jgi:putative DNA primase/helicase